nr:bifunctional DNA primase/polymerase [uncultured Desulfobulbus sp.]
MSNAEPWVKKYLKPKTAPSLSEHAIACLNAGLSVIPCAVHGKKPALKSWAPYQAKRMAHDEAVRLFAKSGCNIAVVAGSISGHLECLDFDNPDLWKPFLDTVESVNQDLRAKLTVWQETPSDGFHLVYRCESPVGGNVKLAMSKQYNNRNGKPQQDTWIETRGQGGYFLIAPSQVLPHTNGTGKYTLHGDLYKLPVLTAEERELLHGIAKSFDEGGHHDREHHQDTTRLHGDRPGDVFNRDADLETMLIHYGWTLTRKVCDRLHLSRPGKADGSTSATLNRQGLFVFTTSTPLPTMKPLDAFAIYTFMEHGGDFSAAARSLRVDSDKSEFPDNSDKSEFPDAVRQLSDKNPTDAQIRDGLSKEVSMFVEADPASFTNNDVYSELCVKTRKEKKIIADALTYLHKSGKINKIEGKRGHWEVVQPEPEPMDILSVGDDRVNLLLPLDIHEHAVIRPGTIISVNGAQNSCKTSFLLTICRNFLSDHRYPPKALPLSSESVLKVVAPTEVKYLNSEMGAVELKQRIVAMGGDPAQWVQHIKFIECNHSYDKQVVSDGITLVDFLEVHDEFYMAGKFIADIHRKLNKGIAVIALQKRQGFSFAKGGEMTLEKPRLAVNLDNNAPHGFICKVVKLKEPVDHRCSIQGMERDFVIGEQSRILPTSDWRFVNEIQRKKINQDYDAYHLPDRVRREGADYRLIEQPKRR